MQDNDVIENLKIIKEVTYRNGEECEYCDLSVGLVCELCNTNAVVGEAIREIEKLRNKNKELQAIAVSLQLEINLKDKTIKEMEENSKRHKCERCGKYYDITGVGWSGCYSYCKDCFKQWRDALITDE